jgi:acyl-CoA ligase (AMP-forming) (exosortase A-associated)
MTTFVHELISESAHKSPSATALTLKSQQLDYARLNTAINDISASYQKLKIKRFDRIGVYLHKTIENVTSLFACSVAQAVFVPINAVLKAPQVQHIVNDCNIKILITNKGRLKGLQEIVKSLPSLTHIIVTDSQEETLAPIAHVSLLSWPTFINLSPPYNDEISSLALKAPLKGTGNDMAAILYTSGSTGKPKGVVLSHANIILGAKSVAQYLNNTADDKILALLPLSFDYGLSQLTTSFLVGASCVLLDYLLPNDVLKAIDKYKITGLAAVPPLWAQLCKLTWQDNAGQSIRYFTNSGGALSKTNLDKLRTLLPQASPYLMYGLTEAFRSTYLPPEEIDLRIGSMGKAIPNAEILVVRKDGSECEAEEVGELVHKGPLVSLGYWNAAEKTAERFKPITSTPSGIVLSEIAVFSGDSVKKDQDGFLYFVARQDEMMKTSGYRISPMEVEEVLYQHPQITEAAVIGVPHQDLGQAILAIVCGKNDQDFSLIEKSINKHCQKELANYMVPKKTIVLNELPHNANGKIDRNQLNLTYKDFFTQSPLI